MSRASELTLFIILLQASIGFTDATGMFSQHYMGSVSNNASYQISDLFSYAMTANEDTGIMDEVRVFAQWGIEALLIGLKIIFTVIVVFPTLVSVFQIPAILSLFIQAGIYYVYAVFYAQYKSGKGWKLYE